MKLTTRISARIALLCMTIGVAIVAPATGASADSTCQVGTDLYDGWAWNCNNFPSSATYFRALVVCKHLYTGNERQVYGNWVRITDHTTRSTAHCHPDQAWLVFTEHK